MSQRLHNSCGAAVRDAARSRTKRPKEWSSEELRLLRDLALDGTPIDKVAAVLRRTASAVRNKAGMHGISVRRR